MRDIRSLASLSSDLLARKGRARPAMRRQLHGGAGGFGGEDLGWNDWGTAEAAPAVTAPVDPVAAAPAPLPVEPVAIAGQLAVEVEHEVPEILRQIDDLKRRIAASPVPAPEPRPEGRRAAFTLRLDAERHLCLRLIAMVQDRSGQDIVTEAFDAYIAQMPEIATLAARARQTR